MITFVIRDCCVLVNLDVFQLSLTIATFDQLRASSAHGDSLRLDEVRKSVTNKNLFLSHSLTDLGLPSLPA